MRELSYRVFIISCLVFMLTMMSVLLTGCGTTAVQIETKEVAVPVKCEVDNFPSKPAQTDDSMQTLKNLLIYYQEVEAIAIGCTQGTQSE